MANRQQLRHGTATPTTGNLLDRELGVDTSAGALYLRVGSDILELYIKPTHNTTTSNPTTGDDADDGYTAFESFWYNTSNGNVYLCVDAAVGAAVWKQIA